MSFYNTCLLIINDSSKNFSIANFWTDDTFNVGTMTFIIKEEIEIIEAKFKAKIQIMLMTGTTGNSNDYHITIRDKSIMII